VGDDCDVADFVHGMIPRKLLVGRLGARSFEGVCERASRPAIEEREYGCDRPQRQPSATREDLMPTLAQPVCRNPSTTKDDKQKRQAIAGLPFRKLIWSVG
jgi:hypothetical protein